MAYSRDQVIAEFLEIYPHCNPTRAGLIFEQAYDHIITMVPIRIRQLSDITIVAGTAEYNLPAGTKRIWEAHRVLNASGAYVTQLREESYEAVTSLGNNSHRHTPSGTPDRFIYYANTTTNARGSILLTPTPDAASVALADRLRLFASVSDGPISGVTNLPESVNTMDAFVSHMARRYSRIKDQERTAYWEAIAERDTHALYLFVTGQTGRYAGSVYPKSPAENFRPI